MKIDGVKLMTTEISFSSQVFGGKTLNNIMFHLLFYNFCF